MFTELFTGTSVSPLINYWLITIYQDASVCKLALMTLKSSFKLLKIIVKYQQKITHCYFSSIFRKTERVG